jgi:hypothetical protein
MSGHLAVRLTRNEGGDQQGCRYPYFRVTIHETSGVAGQARCGRNVLRCIDFSTTQLTTGKALPAFVAHRRKAAAV